MDYEQKYKEALVKAQKELQCCGNLDCDAARQIFKLFPELRESEDEWIRKEILNVVKRFDENSTICGKKYDYNKWIVWLEKHGEQDKQQLYDVPKIPIEIKY